MVLSVGKNRISVFFSCNYFLLILSITNIVPYFLTLFDSFFKITIIVLFRQWVSGRGCSIPMTIKICTASSSGWLSDWFKEPWDYVSSSTRFDVRIPIISIMTMKFWTSFYFIADSRILWKVFEVCVTFSFIRCWPLIFNGVICGGGNNLTVLDAPLFYASFLLRGPRHIFAFGLIHNPPTLPFSLAAFLISEKKSQMHSALVQITDEIIKPKQCVRSGIHSRTNTRCFVTRTRIQLRVRYTPRNRFIFFVKWQKMLKKIWKRYCDFGEIFFFNILNFNSLSIFHKTSFSSAAY